jgi:LysR family transcriptional regulator, glycine cleavage system transcriptional activator
MHKTRDLPDLDLLKAFEAAARHLSFTKAGQALFLSQSAISRQIQALESQLGVPLFHRRVRSLLLTEAGQSYYREISEALQKLREATARLSHAQADGAVTVTTTMTFASLWLVPRLADFQRRHPEVPVHIAADNAIRDLKRSGLDVSIRYSTRQMAGEGAVKLFGERVLPVCSPALLARHALEKPQDLEQFPLLHYEDPERRGPWLSWDVWFEVMGMRPIKGKASLGFSHYDQLMRAAVDGQGVALGRIPLVEELIQSGKLIAPLEGKRYSIGAKNRAYWLLVAPEAAKRPHVQTFAAWLRDRVSAETSQDGASRDGKA